MGFGVRILAEEKAWAPAFAGMNGEGADEGKNEASPTVPLAARRKPAKSIP